MPRNAASVRLSRVLRAGGIEPTPERVQRLADIAQWSIDQIIQRGIPRRPRPPPRRRRPGEPPRSRPIKPRGRPRNPDMRGLFANLAMLWLDEAGYLPGVSFDRVKDPRSLRFVDRHSGRFVAFAQALGAELAVDARALARDVPLAADPLREFAADLGYLAENAAKVRDWLRAARVPALKTAFAPDE